MEKQELQDIPKTREDVRRQKGRTPLTAIFLAIGLLLVLLLFFGPAWVDVLTADPASGEAPGGE